MKCIQKSSFVYAACLGFILLVASCKQAHNRTNESQTSATDSMTTAEPPPTTADSTVRKDTIEKDGKIKPSINRIPASNEEPPQAKGYAMVYCPAKMIIHVPSIIDAEITKAELSAAYTHFIAKVQGQNADKSAQDITKDIKGDSIDIYDNMRVAIEFDSADFEQISKNDNAMQSFTNKQSLDWEWVVKPLHSTRKSIIVFKFYCIYPANNEEIPLLEKTINTAVEVDARSFFEKWGDFLLDDPKTTLVGILIPVVSFLGGFVSAKKKKVTT